MKCYQPEVYFTNEIEEKNEEEFVEVVTLSLTRGVAFLVTIAVSIVMHSLMSVYKKLHN